MITFRDLGNQGRRGNQLWQVATTIGLATANNEEYLFPKWDYPCKLTANMEFKKLPELPTYTEKEFAYNPIPYKKNINISGYYQSILYWVHCQDLIRDLLFPQVEENRSFDVSLHVRRGDYTQPHLKDCFAILGMDYYNAALENFPDAQVAIFSDDISWCKQNFIGDRFIFIEGNSPDVDLKLQSNCKNHIIANSSFSWWGAWFNPDQNKKIIAPSKWFGPKLAPTHNTKDLIPEGWIVI